MVAGFQSPGIGRRASGEPRPERGAALRLPNALAGATAAVIPLFPAGRILLRTDDGTLGVAAPCARQRPAPRKAAASRRELEADRDRWRILIEVNNAVVGNLDLSELLAAITPNLRRIVPHDATNLALLDPESGRVIVYAMDSPLPPELRPRGTRGS